MQVIKQNAAKDIYSIRDINEETPLQGIIDLANELTGLSWTKLPWGLPRIYSICEWMLGLNDYKNQIQIATVDLEYLQLLTNILVVLIK